MAELPTFEPIKDRRSLIFFLLFFLALFLQYPLSGSLPGNTDTWFYLTLFNHYQNLLTGIFGTPAGGAYYPSMPFFLYAEPSFLSGAIFIFFKTIGLPNLWAYYAFISLIYGLNAFALYKIARLYGASTFGALFAGLAFTASNYALGNIDQQNAVVYFPALFSIYYFRKFLFSYEHKHLVYCLLIGGLQIYFSSYIFIFQSVILGLIGLYNIKEIAQTPELRTPLLKYFCIYPILILPFAYLYIFNDRIEQSYDPSSQFKGFIMSSLHLQDFIRVLPNNLIIPESTDINIPLLAHIRSAYIGLSLYVLAAIGLITFRHRIEVLMIALIGLLISIGPYLQLGSTSIPMPMYIYYEILHMDAFMRTPCRAFTIFTIALAILAAMGISHIIKRHKYGIYISFAICFVFLLENIPTPLEKHPSTFFLHPPKEYVALLKEQGQVPCLNLPSSLFSPNNEFIAPLEEYNREHIYTFWQTFHKQPVLNGSAGYFPTPRMNNNDWAKSLSNPQSIPNLISQNNLGYIIYHKTFVLPSDNPKDLSTLKTSEHLTLIKETPSFALFQCNSPSDLQ